VLPERLLSHTMQLSFARAANGSFPPDLHVFVQPVSRPGWVRFGLTTVIYLVWAEGHSVRSAAARPLARG